MAAEQGRPDGLGRLDDVDDLDALVAALSAGREMLVVAPHGTVNTGVVTGGQRHHTGPDDHASGPVRQGPVRAKDLAAARRRFVPPPGFEDALAALDTGVSVLVGAPGTGRETHALNLLAHGRPEPVLVQVDGAVGLSRWVPRPQGVDGYLVMEPPDPFALRSWDLSRLEATLAETGARLLIVLADTPGLAGALGDRLGTPVLRHLPPDPRKVFAAHLADLCPDEGERAALLRALGPDHLGELLPTALPPRHAAHAAHAVSRAPDGASGAYVLRALARAEAPELTVRALEDPVLLAHLLALSGYGGLDLGVVVERAADLLALAGPEWEQDPAPPPGPSGRGGRPRPGLTGQRPLPEILRVLGAHRTRRTGTDSTEPTDTVAFLWPAVGEAVWEVLCRDHMELLPLLHTWLARTGREPDQIARAGWSVAALAVETGGRSLDLLRPLASAPWPSAVEVAARCLGTVVRDPAAAAKAADLLEEWSAAAEPALRTVAVLACHPDHGRLTTDHALRLLHRHTQTPGHRPDALESTAVDALVRRFTAGSPPTRTALLNRLQEWTRADGAPARLATRAFPGMAATDPTWWRDLLADDGDAASGVVQLIGHALDEATAYAAMRDVLLAWCRAPDDGPHPDPAVAELLQRLTTARRPGFLRWLLAVDRTPDPLPGKELAARLLTECRAKPAATTTD
ncbi:hypothetical protein [Streptomyces sp. NPDC088789]|uniref:hypothetical protein n=1 Tax=Streptomyces sp. NPDC088789 TaxID=3365899 RepID=UPI00381D41FA